MATYAQRVAAVEILNRAGRGLVAWTDASVDGIWVKDPDHVVPGGFTAGQTGTETWVQWTGIGAQSAYGL